MDHQERLAGQIVARVDDDAAKRLRRLRESLESTMLELEDNPIPPTFMLLPYEDGMAFAGQHTAASWLDECQRRLGRAKRSASLHRKMALMFLCEVDAEDHAWVDGYDHVIHEPFLLEVPGRTLTTLAPALRVMNGLLGVAGAAGAVAGLPLPRKLPFGLASSDAMQLLGGSASTPTCTPIRCKAQGTCRMTCRRTAAGRTRT